MLEILKQHQTPIAVGAGCLVVGLWIGINFGRGNPIHQNPFADPVVQYRFKAAGDDAIDNLSLSLKRMWAVVTGSEQPVDHHHERCC